MILVELRRAVFFPQAHAEYLTAGCLWLHTMESDSSGGELQEGERRSLAAVPHQYLAAPLRSPHAIIFHNGVFQF